ncbi:MAG: 7,8-dihydro-8-oxoguanine-triphosphatase [Gammaproteobacteria bacterium]|jgi:8-oxo-dGTP diphosphatase|nr:7,8-dihydro-8-oxoguanine-triphosphatase [Gammaproteobacteria bacterium]
MNKTKPAHIAVGVIFDNQRRILVALRPKDKFQGGLWEFPGGKIESGESVEQALKRELFEEVGITVITAEPLTLCDYHYQDHHVHLDVWCVLDFEGDAYGKEGQSVRWVTLEELKKLPMLAANHPIMQAVASYLT